MALPLIAAGVGWYAFDLLVRAPVSRRAAAADEPGVRAASYAGNAKKPNVVAELDGVLDAHFRGFLDWDDVVKTAKYHGIDLSIPGQSPFRRGVWEKVIAARTPRPGPEATRDMLLRGLIERPHAVDILKMNGLAMEEWQRLVLDSSLRPTFGDQLEMLRRGIATTDEVQRWLYQDGFTEIKLRDQLLQLQNLMPGPSDLVRFSVREVWDKDVRDEYGYDKEFPAEFQYWMEKQGLGWGQAPDIPGAGAGLKVPWPLAYWIAHWEIPSPTQSYVMLHRLRPDRMAVYRQQFPDMKPFTLKNVSDVLKISDYAPGFRDQLAAISYLPLTRVDIRRMYQLQVIDRAEVKASYMDLGYTDRNAELLTRFTEKVAAKALGAKAVKVSRGKICEAYNLGILDKATALVNLHYMLLSDAQQALDFAAQPPAVQAAQAAANPAARLALDACDFEARLDQVKAYVKAIRRDFVRFFDDEVEAKDRLMRLGISADAADRFIKLWKAERHPSSKAASVAQTVRWYSEGLIPRAEAEQRLARLGYLPDASGLILASAERALVLAQARAQVKAATSLAKQQAAQARALRALQKEQERTARQLARRASVPQLLKWYRRGLMPEAIARRRMVLFGHSADDINRFIAEAQQQGPLGGSKNGQA